MKRIIDEININSEFDVVDLLFKVAMKYIKKVEQAFKDLDGDKDVTKKKNDLLLQLLQDIYVLTDICENAHTRLTEPRLQEQFKRSFPNLQ